MSENNNQREIDEISGTETTGHEWDGIKELNTPLPRWWLWTFYACIVWSFGYVIAYPAIPLISGATPGVLGYSSRGELESSVELARADQAVFLEQIAAMEPVDIVADEELARFASQGGRSAFKVYCSQCHGSGAQGADGYPNLNDDEWIWGGTVDNIYLTIAHGVRFEDDFDTRFNLMPAFGADEILSSDDINTVAEYVAFIGNLEGGQDSQEGKILYEDNCMACHGEAGVGDPELGGPSLNNAIWLYSNDLERVVAQIKEPRHGQMPAWAQRLDDATTKQLAVYVHSLGGGE